MHSMVRMFYQELCGGVKYRIVSDTYRGIGDIIGRYSGILIPGIGGIDRKTAFCRIEAPISFILS